MAIFSLFYFSDVSIPTNSGDGKPIELSAGQSVMVIKTQKGMYLRLTDGKIVAIRVPAGSESYGLPLNQGSVTIMPTGGRGGQSSRGLLARGGGSGMMRGARRGRPPMGYQHSMGGQIINKGQTAVRIVRRPVVNSKGKTTYQTIAVPVSSTNQQAALLNKSVVITPASRGNSSQFKGSSKNQAPQVTLTPVLPKNSSLSITPVAGTSGNAGGSSSMKDYKKLGRPVASQKSAKPSASVKKDLPDKDKEKMKRKSEESVSKETEADSDFDKTSELPPDVTSEESTVELQKSLSEMSTSDPDTNTPQSNDQSSVISHQSSMETTYNSPGATEARTSNLLPSSQSSDMTSMEHGLPSNTSGNSNTPQDLTSLSSTFPSMSNVQDLSMNSTKSPKSSEITGVVKPNSEGKMSSSLNSLQNMSNMLNDGPSNLLATSSPSYSSGHSSVSTSNSQPLFQPFLHLSSSPATTSVAQVAPQVQSPAYSSRPETSSIYNISSASNTSSASTSSVSLPSMQSSTNLNFSGAAESGQLTRSSTDSALSLSNLLNQYDASSAEELISSAAHSSTLDYLNYSLGAAAGSSAFRRPELPTGPLAADLQSLLTSTASSSPSIAASPSPAPFPAHQSTYSSQYPSSSHYRTAQFNRSSSSAASYNAAAAAAYASQYASPYSSQYSSLAAAAAHANPSSSTQAAAASASAAAAAAAAAASQYPASLQGNPYQAFSASATPGLPPYSSSLGSFGHGPYPPPM